MLLLVFGLSVVAFLGCFVAMVGIVCICRAKQKKRNEESIHQAPIIVSSINIPEPTAPPMITYTTNEHVVATSAPVINFNQMYRQGFSQQFIETRAGKKPKWFGKRMA